MRLDVCTRLLLPKLWERATLLGARYLMFDLYVNTRYVTL